MINSAAAFISLGFALAVLFWLVILYVAIRFNIKE